MGAIYRHLSIEERCEVARLRTAGYSVRQIAASLDRSPSTISRELKRNGSRTQGYQPGYADQQAHARRWHGSKLERNDSLREQVLACLRQNWSSEQVAGRLALEAGRTVVSHETIYRFIYAQIARKKDYSWRHYLPRAKSKRGWRGRKGGNPASFIQLRRPLSERPADASGRDTPGHWEADLMLFGRQGQTVLVLHERHSRLLIALRQPGKAADPVASAMTQVLASFPAPWRRTVAFDNGTEFARHHRLHALGVQTFFCDTHSPWQKGGVENAIGRMRRTLPRKTDLAELPDDRLDQLVRSYNNTPRKCLGYYTPAEILSDYSTNSDYFTNQVLHLKCESSFPPSRVEGRTFQFAFPLPGKKRRKSKPEKDTPPRKPNSKTKTPSKEGTQAKPNTRATTKTDSKGHDRTHSQTSDRKEYARLWGQNSRDESKKNGFCTRCKEKPPIPGQTRCKKCAEKHRTYREKAMQNPEVREKERVRKKQSREGSKGAEAAG